MKELKNKKGITLIALVITIIVMLILVAVTISMAINGGLFDYAGKATGDTKNEINKEQELANGRIKIDGIWYDSIDDYLNNKPSADQGTVGEGTEEEGMPTYATAPKDAQGFLTKNATYESDGYTATVPKGFKISEVEGEKTIGTGLVIKDANGNEFVWIPVTEDLGASYSSGSGYSEPKELTSNYSDSSAPYDSQATLDYLYGENYYNYAEDFKYADEYAEMVAKVNQYNGFYIGRYETTIDEAGNVGSKNNTTVLTTGTTYTNNGTTYRYRWYGLYSASKNMNVPENGSNVQTAMIYGVLWDKTMDFIRNQKTAGKTTYDVDTATPSWHPGASGSVVKSGQANPGANGDVALNIWDLESNAWEWTQEANYSGVRVSRGGVYDVSIPASRRGSDAPTGSITSRSSRSALYIK